MGNAKFLFPFLIFETTEGSFPIKRIDKEQVIDNKRMIVYYRKHEKERFY
ncbi:hypothetical protein [Enterococcus sp. AZ163]